VLQSLVVKFMLGITFIVSTVLCVSLLWDFQYQQQQADKELLVKADLIAKEMQATRSLIAKGQGSVHGGGEPMNISDMGRGVDALFADLANSQVKQTRLVVRDGKNEPDEFERMALQEFAANPDMPAYYARATGSKGEPVFRFLMPLRAEKSCLVCHGEPAGTLDSTGHKREGMKEGDLAGAMSVVMPMDSVLSSRRVESIRMAAGMLLGAVMTLLLIWFILWRQVSEPLRQLAGVAESVGGSRIAVKPDDLKPLYANQETAVVADAFSAMSQRLKELYDGLEQKVADRTAQLQAANLELERASRLKSEFLTMISHEFRTPLTSIMSFTELLLDHAAGQVNQEQREYLTDVLESSQRLLHMINDLLDLSRLEAGKIKLFREVVAMHDLARDAEHTVRPLAEKKGITLTVECPAGLPLVQADPLRVTQVLLNLMGNAIKFTPEGGSIRMTARESGDFLEVAVTDTGIGIAPEEQARVFEAFRQAGRQRPEGSGLGLALARSFIELHGGRIWVDSEPGMGSTFRFTLPLSAEGRGMQDDHGS
jgi:signal transduction histidine kinase